MQEIEVKNHCFYVFFERRKRKMKKKTEIFGNFERKRKKTESEGSEM